MNSTVTHATFTIERRYSAAPERVFTAFADPAKKRRWFAERELRNAEFAMDFQVGGREQTKAVMGPDTPFPGAAITNDTVYQDIAPNRRIVFAYTMTIGGKRISASLATVELLPSDTGTLLLFTEQGAFFEGSDGPGMRQEGWNSILDALTREIE
ncbi:MAG TPA: SRPBCC family protein [Bryobacteraceae bacterium]|nr:SRPBCC family protein [Bryobacteraceae bacterium]